MARFSVRDGRWHGLRGPQRTYQETERDEREFMTDLGNGMVRVDIGAPIPRLSCEPRPVPVKAPAPAPLAAPVEPETPPSLPEAPRAKSPQSPKLPAFKPGLGKG